MKPKIILIADDDREDREMLEDIITGIDSDTVIHSLASGPQVQDFLENCNDDKLPSIIVLDYNMPVMTGAELLTKIYKEEKYRSIPIVMLSTSNAQKHVEECLAKGANEYFVKPTDYFELKSLAEKILDIAC
jgi:CheY-like chemotaxis protein